MISLEKLLESLLEPSGRPTVKSRAELAQLVLDIAMTLTDAHAAALVEPATRRATRHVLPGNLAEQLRFDVPQGGTDFSRRLGRTGVPINIADVARDARVITADDGPGFEVGPALFVPLRVREANPGYVAVYRTQGSERFSDDQAALLTLLATYVSLTLESFRLSASVEKLAVTDDLTQVYNYRFLKSSLRREIKRAGRFKQNLSIIMIDVDNLKAYNDRHGHLRGSFLLKQIAGRFSAQVRSFDIVSKYGGDEFTIILPQTDREGALVVAERMRVSVAESTFPLAEKGQITVSLGISTFPEDALDANGLIQAADRRLYAAKRHGRNRVESDWKEAA